MCLSTSTPTGVFSSLVPHGLAKKLVRQFTSGPTLYDLKHVVGELCFEGLIQQEEFYWSLTKKSILVPLTTNTQSKEASLLLTRELAKRLHLPYLTQSNKIRELDDLSQIYLVTCSLPTKEVIQTEVSHLKKMGNHSIYLVSLIGY